MWVRMALALGVAAALVAALVVWVHHATDDTPSEAPVSNPKAVAEQNREAAVVVGQDQRPHVVAFSAGGAPAAAVRHAVTGYMSAQIRQGWIGGPLMHSGCERAGGPPARQVWHCTVVAANVNYPFDAVVEPVARRLTYCKRDLPPVPSMNIPVSSRCT
jgi:hypothetical protein